MRDATKEPKEYDLSAKGVILSLAYDESLLLYLSDDVHIHVL